MGMRNAFEHGFFNLLVHGERISWSSAVSFALGACYEIFPVYRMKLVTQAGNEMSRCISHLTMPLLLFSTGLGWDSLIVDTNHFRIQFQAILVRIGCPGS